MAELKFETGVQEYTVHGVKGDEGGQNAFGCLRRDDRQHRQHDCKARQSKSRCR